ncbi:MAG TPA: GlsB/YeaQ/YmgE family stress response membrane protein, partial [Acidobacteriota bacterium]
GYFGRMMGFYQAGQAAGFLMSLAGAILLLILYRVLVKRRS